jgi:hypothetical protein
VEIVNERTPAGAETAFEVFLEMEAASWKGREGTALLCNADDARFCRRLIQGLAANNLASVQLLRLDGDAIAAQVLLYSGQRAYTWKTAFKASFARFSPGVLLADKATQNLLETCRIVAIDSCSSPDSAIRAHEARLQNSGATRSDRRGRRAGAIIAGLALTAFAYARTRLGAAAEARSSHLFSRARGG